MWKNKPISQQNGKQDCRPNHPQSFRLDDRQYDKQSDRQDNTQDNRQNFVTARNRTKTLSIREMCFFAIYGACMFVFKMMMAGLPNIEPVSLMVILLAVVFGWKGIWSVVIYVFLEYLTWGLQIWSVGYLYTWPLLFGLAVLFKKMDSSFRWGLLAGTFGLGFGALYALPYLMISGWQTALLWWIEGIPFDLLHGAGNFILTWILFSPLKKGLKQLAQNSRLI